jgi:putative peptidoglycan lipid II flippase
LTSTKTEGGGDLSRNTLVMAAGTILSRATGFGRVFALAYALGFTRLADAYNLANTTPNILYDLVLGGILSATLVPVFVTHLDRADEEDPWRPVSAVVTVSAVLLAALSALFAIVAPLVIRLYTALNNTGSAGDERAVATTLLRYFAPQVFLLGLIAVTAAILNARRNFATPAFSPVVNNVVAIVVLLATPHVAHHLDLGDVRHDPGALAFLGLGTTAGYLAQALYQLPAMRRAGVHLRWVWDLREPAVRRVARLSTWTFGSVLTNQVAFFVVLVLAARADGGVSSYSAAYLFFQLPYAIFTVSVMRALQPDLAAAWSGGDADRFRTQLGDGLRLTAALLIPAAAGYAVLGRPIIQLVLEHGRLSHGQALVTADTLSLMALGLPGFSAYLLLISAYQAMQDTRTMFFLYGLENAVNVVLAVALFPSLGVQGLAIALAGAYAVGFAAAFAQLRRRARWADGAALGSVVLRVVAASLLMVLVVFVISHGIGSGRAIRTATAVIASVVAGGTVYVVAARLLGVTEVSALLSRLRRPRQ